MLCMRIVANNLFKGKAPFRVIQSANYSSHVYDEKAIIGKREWVGYGLSGSPNYFDTIVVPLPAVRFREITGDLIAIREKEKGDWRKMSLEEKKKLYRANFRQTLEEVQAPTGEWKSILGATLLVVSAGIWVFILQKLYLYPPKPESFSEENRKLRLRAMLVNRDGFISGISSKWDYEKDDWK